MDKNNKNIKFLKKTSATLAILALLSPFTSCINKTDTINQDDIKSKNYSNSASDFESNNYSNQSKLDNINANFSFKKWNGISHLTIDQDSLYEIAKLALDDVKNFYQSIDSPNFQFDENGNRATGKDNFYPTWFDENYVLAQAKMESSEIFMIDYKANLLNNQNVPYRDSLQPQGVMQITPEILSNHLINYFKTFYKYDWSDQAKMQIYPSENDIQNLNSQNIETRKSAIENIKQSVYNNLIWSITYNVQIAKSLGPNHADYYEKYGGFSNDIYFKALTYSYLFGLSDTISKLKSGYDFNQTKYVSNIEKFKNEFKAEYANANQMQ